MSRSPFPQGSPSPLPGPDDYKIPSRDPGAHYLKEEDEIAEEHLRVSVMEGYQFSWTREIGWWILGIMSGFLAWLIGYWFPVQAIRIRYRRSDLASADYVLVVGEQNGHEFVPVEEATPEPLIEKPHLFTYAPYLPIAQHIPQDRKMIVFRHTRFLFNTSTSTFERVRYLTSLPAFQVVERCKLGMRSSEYEDKLTQYGYNQIVIIVKSIPSMLMAEVFHPFFVFQIYSVILWCFEDYFIFAGCIAFIASVSIVTTLIETRRRYLSLRELARFECDVNVKRNGVFSTISSHHLVPGDLIELPQHGTVPADIALIDGSAVVNESMLTGESVPVIKSSVPLPANKESSLPISLGADDRSTLYSATKILQLKPSAPNSPVVGIVVRAGYATTKGNLLLSMMFPRPSSFKFEEQSYKFIGALFCLALVGFGISVWQLERINAATSTIFIRGLDLITIALPPSLPLAMSVGVNFALIALKKKLIYCISPARINMAGKVRHMCFDKTGTLTAEGMELKGVQPVIGNSFAPFQHAPAPPVPSLHQVEEHHNENSSLGLMKDSNQLTPEAESPHFELPSSASSLSLSDIPIQGEIRQAMAVCHGLAQLMNSESHQNELIGDPLEVKIFESTHANLIDTGDLKGYLALINVPSPLHVENETPNQYGIRTRFEFVSKLQRMSVIAENLETHAITAFVKGSPEVMQTLCIPSSLPSDFKSVLSKFAHQGYRVIAVGSKPMSSIPSLEPNELRQVVESELRFLGLVVLENKVKPESAPTLRVLRAALVRSIMVTGDNPLTAVSVAKECELVEPGTRVFLSEIDENGALQWVDTDDPNNTLDPHTLIPRDQGNNDAPYELACTGPVFRRLEESDNASMIDRVVLNGVIFARMTPEQKASLVSRLQHLGLYTGMCGDGANDCAALKTAHIGVSLSQTEASIAAPFTYLEPHIGCIPILLCEGRSSLITSYQLFRYMAMYSIIQFTAVILCYFKGSVLGNWQYLYQDLWVVFPLTIFMGDTPASRHLTRKRPSGNLLSLTNAFNVCCHAVIHLSFQLAVFFLTRQADGYHDNSLDPGFSNDSHTQEATSLYYFSNFQYSVMALLFAMGRPWKKAVYHNWKFSGWWIITLICSLLLLFASNQVGKFREDDQPLASTWRRTIFVIVLINAAVSCLFELLVFPFLVSFYKSWNLRGFLQGQVYGRKKNLGGPNAKPFHVIRGEFENNWKSTFISPNSVHVRIRAE